MRSSLHHTTILCTGFLRVSASAEPLDCTRVHPEAYPVARSVLAAAGVSPKYLKKASSSEVNYEAYKS
jgi:protein Tex